MFIEDLYRAALICFDNDVVDDDGGNTDPPATPGKIEFTESQQELVNKLMAEEKRKATQKAEKDAAKREEQRIQDLLTEKDLGERQRQKLEEDLENAQKRLRTKEENEKHERKKFEEQFTKQLTDAQERAKAAEDKYRKSTILRSLQDAAVAEDAHNPSIVVTYLENKVKWNDEGEQVMVELTVPTDEGKEEPLLMTPHEAVKRMKTMVNQFGGLFKSNLVSGVGGSAGPGGGAGKLDPAKMSMDEYMRIRAEAPERLGLSHRGRR